MSDEIIGHQINCAICGSFIDFEPLGKNSTKTCPNNCTLECISPSMHGIITDIKVPNYEDKE